MSEKKDFVSKISNGLIDDDSLIGQLFIALSTWWYFADIPVIGVSHKALGQIIHGAQLDKLLVELEDRVAPLNLELIEYFYNRQRWYCLRSKIVAPSMLTEKEQSVLGIIIHQIFYPILIEQRRIEISATQQNADTSIEEEFLGSDSKDLFSQFESPVKKFNNFDPEDLIRDKKAGKRAKQAPHIETKILRQKLLGKYFNTKTELDRILQKLADFGYIIIEKKQIFFGPRTLFEYPIESLEEIAENVAYLFK